MARITVYLPDELAGLVKASDISVSPVCQAALEAELNRRNAVKTATQDLSAVASRLRTTQDEDLDLSDHDRGFAVGVEWASTTASLDELQALHSLAATDWLSLSLTTSHSLHAVLADLLRIPEVGRDPGMEWQIPRTPFVNGVVDGAVDLYGRVLPLV